MATGDEKRGDLTAEIVTTGTEILLGEIVDTNAAWIAQQLRESGINLYYKTTVGDNVARVRQVIEQGIGRSDVVLVTGGLGPTRDDITRDAIAAATGRDLILHEEAVETLKARFARFGAQMTENNLRQAYIPAGAALVENPVGTAPGFIVEGDVEGGRGTVIAMPGVPREMKQMMTATVLPYLRARNGNSGIIRRRVLRTIGIGESTVDHHLADLMDRANPTVGLAAHPGQVDVRVTAKAQTDAAVEALLDAIEAEVRARIGDYIYSVTAGESFASVLAALLDARGASVVVGETNSGGAVAARLRQAAGDSSAVTAVSLTAANLPVGEAAAREQAAALRAAHGATHAVAILGTMGEDQGVFGSQQGETWIAVDAQSSPADDQAATVRIPYGGTEELTVQRIGNTALTQLWRVLRPVAEVQTGG